MCFNPNLRYLLTRIGLTTGHTSQGHTWFLLEELASKPSAIWPAIQKFWNTEWFPKPIAAHLHLQSLSSVIQKLPTVLWPKTPPIIRQSRWLVSNGHPQPFIIFNPSKKIQVYIWMNKTFISLGKEVLCLLSIRWNQELFYRLLDKLPYTLSERAVR